MTALQDAIGTSAGKGLRWSLFATLATKIGSFGMALVLARILTPDDFGLFAIALAATAFVMHINDVGLIAAVIQWRGRLAEVAPTATTLTLVFSAAVYALFWFGAPAFAELSGNPAAAPVVRLLTTVILIDGITAVRVAAIQRRFEQRHIAIGNMAGFALQAPIAIGLALAGAGAYSFAWGLVAQATVTGAYLMWRAKLPFRLGLDRVLARRLLAYGIPLAAGLGVEALLMNADFVIVGRLLGPAALGFYLVAFNISSWVANTLGTAIRYVSVPGFSRLAEEDGSLSAGVGRAVPLLLTGALPIAVIMGVLATPLIDFLYGDRWEPAAAALGFLMVLAIIRLLTGLTLDVLMGSGATRSVLWVYLGWAVVLVPALLVGTLIDGIRGTAIAHVVVGVVVALPLACWALHRAGIELAPVARRSVRPLLASALAAATALIVADAVGGTSFVTLAAAGPAALAVYALAAFAPFRRNLA